MDLGILSRHDDAIVVVSVMTEVFEAAIPPILGLVDKLQHTCLIKRRCSELN